MATKKATKKAVKAPASRNPLQVGKCVFIRTVTGFFTGRVVELDAVDIVLEDAAWIADTGRFAAAMATGSLSEIEPYPGGKTILVARGAVVDVCEWLHALPLAVK